MPFAHELAQWVLAFDAGSIPLHVIEKTKAHLLDSLGCAFGALDEEAPRGTLRTVEILGGTPDCTVIGTGIRTSVANAVLANGVLVRTLDLNDLATGWGGAGHPSDTIPVALAMGERLGSSGRDVLGATVLGYQIASRIPSRSDGRGSSWDGATGAGVVASAMAGWLMKLSPDRLANALALGISHSGTLSIVRRGQLSAAKSIASSMAAHTAVTATLLAAEGVTGPPTALEEWSKATLGGADLAPMIAPLTGEFGIMHVGLKAHPCIGTAQTAVEAALRVRSAMPAPLPEIERVEIHMADIPFVRGQVDDQERRNPTTRETADHSFPFLVAVALLDGELTLRQFEKDRWFDPTVRALMDRMTIEPDPALNRHLPGAFPSAVRVFDRSGKEYGEEVPYQPGHNKNFMSPAQVQAKFHRFSQVVPQAQRDAIIAAVDGLDAAASVRPPMELTALH